MSQNINAKWLRHRFWFLVGGSILALALSIVSDPDGHLSLLVRESWLGSLGIGLSTILGGLALIQGVWAVAFSQWARKAVFGYPEADMRMLFAKASQSSIGAGLALIALAIILLGFEMVFAPRAHADVLPAGFLKYGAMLKAEQMRYWSGHSDSVLLASLTEEESCNPTKPKQCWSPEAKLKTEREEGAGAGQLTRAYRADGSLRFDALSELRNKYRTDLGELSWNNVYHRPDLQFRAIVLKSRDAAKPFSGTPAMLEFGDAAYNGGIEGVQKERRACALSRGCDPGKWFGNVEAHCLKSRKPIYGNRSACDINRTHVHNVLLVRPQKYRKAWATL